VSGAHKALVRRFLEEIHNQGNLVAAEEFIHAAHVRHTNQTTGGGRDFHGPDGFRQAVGAFRRAFSNIHFTEDGLFVDGDIVILRWTSRGVHTGEFNGIPPTGRRVTTTGVDVFRMADGKILERWAYDDGSLLRQLTGPDPALPR
jgi:predicted ester cyclase